MQIDDYSLEIAKVQIYMRLLGYQWDSPRVVQFLDRLKMRSRYDLSLPAYRRLGEALSHVWEHELSREQKSARLYALSEGVKLDEVA